jgi:hypothetical protein
MAVPILAGPRDWLPDYDRSRKKRGMLTEGNEKLLCLLDQNFPDDLDK